MSDEKRNDVKYQGKLYGAELRFTPNGVAVCEGRMSVNRKDKRTDEWQSAWFSVTAWRETAEAMAEIEDKAEVIVTGYLDVDPGYTKRDGTEVDNRVKVTALQVEKVADPRERPQSQPQQVTQEDFDSVPF